jgi:tetratricopeptide (TPR) repeat protein
MSRRVAIAGCVIAALTVCCRPGHDSAGIPGPALAAGVPAGQNLSPVTLPDLASLAEPVQRQVRARYVALSHALDDPGASAAERAAGYGALGHVLMASKFFDEAAACYLHAQSVAPADLRWPYYLGHAYLRNGDRAAAEASFVRALSLQPTDLPTLIWLGDTYLDDGRTDVAEATYARALSVKPDSAAALFGAGRAALARQAYRDAAQYMERALAVEPQATTIHYPLAMAYRALGARDRAEALLKARGDTPPALPDPLLVESEVLLDSAVSYEDRGMEALRSQQWAAAADAFRKGLEIAPDDTSLRYWLGTALYVSGDTAGAEREFQTVVGEAPTFARAHFSLGAIFEARGQHVAARAEFSAAVQHDPNMAEARLRLAEIERSTGQLAAALTQYEAAVHLDPRMAGAWIGGARTLIDLKEHGKARQWLAQATRVHPGQRELMELQTEVSAGP